MTQVEYSVQKNIVDFFFYLRSTQEFLRTCLNVSVRSRSDWNLEVLVFEERGKPEYPEKNLSEQRRESTTNSTHIWRRRLDSNPGHIGRRRVLLPLRHSSSTCAPVISTKRTRILNVMITVQTNVFSIVFETFSLREK